MTRGFVARAVSALVTASVAGCIGPSPQPPSGVVHVILRNHHSTAVDWTFDATGPGRGSGGGGTTAGCAFDTLEIAFEPTWELKVGGQHAVGSADRSDLRPVPGLARDVIVMVDVIAEGPVVSGVHPGTILPQSGSVGGARCRVRRD